MPDITPVLLPSKLVVFINAGKAALEIVIDSKQFEEVYSDLNGQQVTLYVEKAFPIPDDEPITQYIRIANLPPTTEY